MEFASKSFSHPFARGKHLNVSFGFSAANSLAATCHFNAKARNTVDQQNKVLAIGSPLIVSHVSINSSTPELCPKCSFWLEKWPIHFYWQLRLQMNRHVAGVVLSFMRRSVSSRSDHKWSTSSMIRPVCVCVSQAQFHLFRQNFSAVPALEQNQHTGLKISHAILSLVPYA